MWKTVPSDKLVIGLLFILNFLSYEVYGQGNCVTSDFAIEFVYFKVTPGKILADPIQIRIENTIRVLQHTENPSTDENYFNFVYEGNAVLASTTNEFLNYERHQIKTELIATVRLSCANGLAVNMIVTFEFEDVNNFAPEFSQPSYEIAIPLPLPPDVDIFKLISDRILARDNDLQNNQITFTSDISYQPFRVETSRETGSLGKEFFANIFTTGRILNIIESDYFDDIEFIVTATDAGTAEQKSTSAKVKLVAKPDYEGLIEIPVFQQKLYYGTLDFERPWLILSVGPIHAETYYTFVESIDFITESNDTKYFRLERHNKYNTVSLFLRDDVTEDDLNGQTSFSFGVRATGLYGFRADTSVYIKLVQKDLTKLRFGNIVYTGIINSDMTVDYDRIQLFGSTLDVEVSIKNDLLGWFEITQYHYNNSHVNEIYIRLMRPLSELDIVNKTIVSLNVLATSYDDAILGAESHIALAFEKTGEYELSFENTFYEGFITTDLKITGLGVLKLTGRTVQNVQYALSDYTDLFETVKTADGLLIITKNLAAADISDKKTFLFEVTATSRDAIPVSVVVILTVEPVELADSVLPIFEKHTYTGYLEKPYTSDSLNLEYVLLNSNTLNVEFGLSGEDTNLIMIGSTLNNGVILGLANGVTVDDIEIKTVLTVIVTAKVTKSVIGSAAVIIHVDKGEVPIECVYEDNVGLIVTISVLAAIIVVARIVSSVLWWKFVRPHTYMRKTRFVDLKPRIIE